MKEAVQGLMGAPLHTFHPSPPGRLNSTVRGLFLWVRFYVRLKYKSFGEWGERISHYQLNMDEFVLPMHSRTHHIRVHNNRILPQ